VADIAKWSLSQRHPFSPFSSRQMWRGTLPLVAAAARCPVNRPWHSTPSRISNKYLRNFRRMSNRPRLRSRAAAALLDALSAGRHRKLTLLSAPAGRARRLYWRSGLWMPVNLHLVLATRSDPMLPLARLRASADLVEMQPRRCWSAPRSSRTSVITRRRRQRGTTVSGFFSHRALASPTHDTAARGW
jgi:hypothetical protein